MLNQAIYLFISVLVLAYLEVQIEGKHGWAGQLPTWRGGDQWYSRFYRKLMGGKELTGYHIGIFGFVFLFLHSPFFFRRIKLEHRGRTLDAFAVFLVCRGLGLPLDYHQSALRRHPPQTEK